mgnify:CR=1 FL=1
MGSSEVAQGTDSTFFHNGEAVQVVQVCVLMITPLVLGNFQAVGMLLPLSIYV